MSSTQRRLGDETPRLKTRDDRHLGQVADVRQVEGRKTPLILVVVKDTQSPWNNDLLTLRMRNPAIVPAKGVDVEFAIGQKRSKPNRRGNRKKRDAAIDGLLAGEVPSR